MNRLRDYQERQIAETRTALGKYRHIILQSPTGSGKGVLIGNIASSCVKKGNRILILAHGTEILEQDAGHSENWGGEGGKGLCLYAEDSVRAVLLYDGSDCTAEGEERGVAEVVSLFRYVYAGRVPQSGV